MKIHGATATVFAGDSGGFQILVESRHLGDDREHAVRSGASLSAPVQQGLDEFGNERQCLFLPVFRGAGAGHQEWLRSIEMKIMPAERPNLSASQARTRGDEIEEAALPARRFDQSPQFLVGEGTARLRGPSPGIDGLDVSQGISANPTVLFAPAKKSPGNGQVIIQRFRGESGRLGRAPLKKRRRRRIAQALPSAVTKQAHEPDADVAAVLRRTTLGLEVCNECGCVISNGPPRRFRDRDGDRQPGNFPLPLADNFAKHAAGDILVRDTECHRLRPNHPGNAESAVIGPCRHDSPVLPALGFENIAH